MRKLMKFEDSYLQVEEVQKECAQMHLIVLHVQIIPTHL